MKNHHTNTNFKSSWKYAEAPESTDHIKINKQYDLYIDGKFVKPTKGKYFDTINPANDQKITRVAEASAEDVNKAVKAARNAFKGGQNFPAESVGNTFSNCAINPRTCARICCD